MSKAMTAQDYMMIIEYNHHLYPSTWGKCINDCGRSARGCGLCVDCAKDKLAKFIGLIDAYDFVSHVKGLHEFKCKIQKKLETIE